MYKKISVFALFIMITAPSLFADNQFAFHLSPVTDATITGTLALLDGTVMYLDKTEKTDRMDFDGTICQSSTVPAFDRLIMQPYSKKLDTAGDALLIASCLSPALLICGNEAAGISGTPSEYLTIGVMYAQTMLAAYGLKELGKLIVNRQRPYMYFSDYPSSAVDDGDWCKSFPSGHTTMAFAAASFTSYVFCTMYPDSGKKIPVIATSYSLAVATAAFRIASGNHFMTDVITGAAIGTVCGFIVPYLHTSLNRKKNELSVSLLPQGIHVLYKW